MWCYHATTQAERLRPTHTHLDQAGLVLGVERVCQRLRQFGFVGCECHGTSSTCTCSLFYAPGCTHKIQRPPLPPAPPPQTAEACVTSPPHADMTRCTAVTSPRTTTQPKLPNRPNPPHHGTNSLRSGTYRTLAPPEKTCIHGRTHLQVLWHGCAALPQRLDQVRCVALLLLRDEGDGGSLGACAPGAAHSAGASGCAWKAVD